MAASSQDLTFLRADIKRQHEIAQEVSEEAERLETLLKESAIPPELKPKLEQSRTRSCGLRADWGRTRGPCQPSSLIVRWVVRLYALAVAVTSRVPHFSRYLA